MPTTVNLGRVQPIYKGAYDDAAVYTPLDFVTYNGATYFCILTTTAGTLPTNTTHWQLVANAALAGAIGFDDANSILVGANVQTALDSLGSATGDIDLGSIAGFTGGTARIVKIGNVVTLSVVSLAFFSDVSASGVVVPTEYRPQGSVGQVVRIAAGRIEFAEVASNGTLLVEFRDYTGTPTATSTMFGFTLSWVMV